MYRKIIYSFLIAGICTSSAWAEGFLNKVVKGATGGSIDIEKGEICAGPACVNKNGSTRTKNLDETIDDAIGQAVPGYSVLSDADKENIRGAAKATGIVMAKTSMDPITGGLVIKILSGEKEEEVIVQSYQPHPALTAAQYSVTAACLVQRDANSITAAFIDENGSLLKIKQGDLVSLTAPICAGFGQSITSVTMVATSQPTPVETSAKFKWVLLGTIKT